ncbi:MAG: porin, partial [Rhodospirillales bacterium]|nr:porin [Rhodospirillales bacterium]
MRPSKTSLSAWLLAASCLAPIGLAVPAVAQTAPPAGPASEKPAAPEPAAEAPPYSGLVIDGIKLSAQLDAGFMMNPFRPNTGLNWGHLFTDHANQAQLNQLLLTAAKPLDPTNPDFQWGFKLQFMYGSDARYTQFLGELNRVTPDSRYQLDVVEANALFHLPVLTAGGIDLKAGQYTTPIGYETIDPATNPFYSHSYIFQFGLPFKHTGLLTTTHVNETVDVYAGIDTGANTTFGPLGENNSSVGGIFGFGLNGLMDGKLTILALTHLGPEQSSRVLSPLGINANGQWRYFNDIVITYKATDALTLVTELNWIRDDYGVGKGAVNGFGAAQYVSYALNDTVTLNARGELWRDDNNFFVASFSNNGDPIRVQQGLPAVGGVYGAPGGSTTYGSLTLGVTWKPEVPPPVVGLMIRPEIRWDHAYTSNKPFNQNPPAYTKGTSDNFTFGADAVL